MNEFQTKFALLKLLGGNMTTTPPLEPIEMVNRGELAASTSKLHQGPPACAGHEVRMHGRNL
ncbi:MAG TPA: hypothetical protein VJS30_15210 [Paraburkholderia sp.]|nr:hypothetical protein [Paraburkholderia sp.]